MALSDTAIRKAKPANKPYKLTDGGGLYLHIRPSGSKLWRLKFRCLGKEKLLSFGKYPTISLAAARKKRDEAKVQLAEGMDPAAQRKLARLAAETAARQTFGLIAEEYVTRMEEGGAAAKVKTDQDIELRQQIRFGAVIEPSGGEDEQAVLVERRAMGGDRAASAEEPARRAPGR